MKFLVDTGSRPSILPCNRPDDDPRFSRWLCTADGTRIPAFEHVTLSVSLNLGKTFFWKFLRARVKFATLGLDFLTHHNVLVNPAKRTLQCEVNCTPTAKIGQSLDLGLSPEREFAQAEEKTKVGQIPRPFKSLEELRRREQLEQSFQEEEQRRGQEELHWKKEEAIRLQAEEVKRKEGEARRLQAELRREQDLQERQRFRTEKERERLAQEEAKPRREGAQ